MTLDARKARPVGLAGCAAIVAFGLLSCKGPAAMVRDARIRAVQDAVDGVNRRLVAADTDFGLELLSRMVKDRPQDNAFLSPVSLAVALHMAYGGARGETQTAMAKVLRLEGRGTEQLAADDRALMAALRTRGRGVRLEATNSVWVDRRVSLKHEFTKATTTGYDARIASLDFSVPGAARTINAWGRKQTHGAIDGIVNDEYLIGRQIVLVLANAMWFRGKWHEPFKASNTKEGTFTAADGHRIAVPMMSRTDTMPYLETADLQAIRLDYATGQFSFLVLLPSRTSSLRELCGTLTGQKLTEWENGLVHLQGTLRLPRFKCTGDAKLKPALTAMGMGAAFDGSQADFSGLSDAGVWLDDVLHGTYVDVNERGTEIAAVSAVGMPMAGPGPQKPFEMTVDRPFLCAIRDDETKTVLFLGAIVEPK